MPKEKKTHEDFRKYVCLFCLKKGKDSRGINEKEYENINTHFVIGLNRDDERLPNAMCITCRMVLRKTSAGDYSKYFELFDYSKLNPLKPITRTSSSCECMICMNVRSVPFKTNNKENISSTTSRGRPSQYKHTQTPIKSMFSMPNTSCKG